MFRKFLIICCFFILYVGCFNPTNNIAVLKINNTFVIANANNGSAAWDGFQKNMEKLDNPLEDNSVAKTLDKIAKYIPGPIYDLYTTIKLFTYYGIASRDADTSEIELVTFLGTIAQTISTLEADDTIKNYPFRLARQLAYKTNQYCVDQQIYIEESNLISKQGEGRPSHGNAIYPVYPEIPGVQHNYCSREFPTFKKGASSILGGNGLLTPLDSRCSFTYAPENYSCLMTMALPTLAAYYTAELSYRLLEYTTGCISGASDVSGATSAIKTAKQAIKIATTVFKVIGEIATSVYGILGNSISDDPYSMLATKAVPKVFGLIFIDIAAIVQFALTFRWHCIFTRLVMKYLPLTLGRAAVETAAAVQFNRAKEAIQTTQFCGWDWLSWSNDYNYNDENTYRNIPTIGMNENSRSKDINNCIDNKKCDGSKIIGESQCERGILTDCGDVKRYSYDIRNKFFREYKYGGKEYSLSENANNFYLDVEKAKDTSDNRTERITYNYVDCIDPRLPQIKGYDTISQRYYMRGNQKANFACNRFFYDGSGCLLKSDLIESEDIGQIDSNKFKVEQDGKVYYYIDGNEYPDLANKYYSQCNAQFKNARLCCKKRSEYLVCLEKIKPESDGNIKNTATYVFCMSNVITSPTTGTKSTVIDFIKDSKNQDKFKDTCKLGSDSFEATKKKGTQYICVFANGFCPYNFRLNGGLNYRASFCDSNSLGTIGAKDEGLPRFENHLDEQKCKEGIFYGVMKDDKRQFNSVRAARYHAFSSGRENDKGVNNKTYNLFVFSKYLQEDMKDYNKNDFDIIYNKEYKDRGSYVTHKNGYYQMSHNDFVKFSNGNISKIKNFCQYRAHCVEVEKEQDIGETYQSMSMFMDSSCISSSVNSRVNTTLSLVGQNVSRQLSAPVAECIYESLSNLVLGVAGSSKCKKGYELNDDGYCGEDTKKDVEEMKRNNLSALWDKYEEIDGVLIIKGDKLPDVSNPFKKLQRNLLGAAKALVSLFIAIWGFRQLYNNKIEEVIKWAIGGKFGMFILSVAVTMWLGFGTGLYDEVFIQIKRLSIGAYMFMNEMFISNVNSRHNTILNSDGKLRKVKLKLEDNVNNTVTNYPVCYHYSSVGNLFIVDAKNNGSCPLGYNNSRGEDICVYTGKDELDSSCANKMLIKNNQNIQTLLYFIDKFNINNFDRLKLYGMNNNKEVLDLNNINLWNNKYDGCYFSIYEYPEGKEYLSIFDTIDCKFARYLGFTYDDGLPNLFVFAAMSMIPELVSNVPVLGGISAIVGKIFNIVGTIIFTLAIAFFLGLMNILLKIVYIFVSSFFSLSILLFLCPIFLPMMLLENTKKIFGNWKNEILASIIQPMLNISAIILFLNVFDNFFYSGITFSKFNESGRIPSIECGDKIVNIMCSFKGVPVVSDVVKIIKNPSTSLYYIINLLIALLFVMFGDKVIDEIKQFTGKIVTFGAPGKNQFNDAKGIIDDEQEKPTFERLSNISSNIDSAVGTVKSIERAPLTIASKMAGEIDDLKEEKYEYARNRLFMQQELESKRADGTITEKELKQLNKITKFEKKEELENKLVSGTITKREMKKLDKINTRSVRTKDGLQKIVDTGKPTRTASEFVGAISDPINYASNRVRENIARSYNNYSSATKTLIQTGRVLDSLVGVLNKDRNNGGFISEMKQIDEQRKFDNTQRKLNKMSKISDGAVKEDLQKATGKYHKKTQRTQNKIDKNRSDIAAMRKQKQELQEQIDRINNSGASKKENSREYKRLRKQLEKTRDKINKFTHKNEELTEKMHHVRQKIYNKTLQKKQQDVMSRTADDQRVFNWQNQQAQDKKDKK